MRDEFDFQTSPFETIDDPDHFVERNMSLQRSLFETMHAAQERGEFVGGVHNAAEQLDADANSIALCILVDTKQADPGVQIHCRLIEAFCWEFPIPVIKVNSSRKLMNLAGYSSSNTETVHCILIKATGDLNPPLEKIVKFSQQKPTSIVKLR